MVIKVERGCPTPEELAAVVALVQARAAATGPEDDEAPEPTAWSDPAGNVQPPMPRPGPTAWRTSVWPR